MFVCLAKHSKTRYKSGVKVLGIHDGDINVGILVLALSKEGTMSKLQPLFDSWDSTGEPVIRVTSVIKNVRLNTL